MQAKLGDKHPHASGLTEDHKRKISATMTGTRRGEFNPMYGRKHTAMKPSPRFARRRMNAPKCDGVSNHRVKLT